MWKKEYKKDTGNALKIYQYINISIINRINRLRARREKSAGFGEEGRRKGKKQMDMSMPYGLWKFPFWRRKTVNKLFLLKIWGFDTIFSKFRSKNTKSWFLKTWIYRMYVNNINDYNQLQYICAIRHIQIDIMLCDSDTMYY